MKKVYSGKERMKIYRSDIMYKNRIINGYLKGTSLEILAEKYKITTASVRKLLKEWEVDKKCIGTITSPPA